MLERLFTSKTRIRILDLLMFNQDKTYHTREIARKIRASPIQVSSELENLEKAGIVKRSRKGNLRLSQIKRSSPILEDLRRLFMKTEGFWRVLRDGLEGKVKYAFIYGSFAEGDEDEHSDVDIFVVSEIDDNELIRIIHEAEKKTGREINPLRWGEKALLERARKGHHLLKDIVERKMVGVVGDEREIRNWLNKALEKSDAGQEPGPTDTASF